MYHSLKQYSFKKCEIFFNFPLYLKPFKTLYFPPLQTPKYSLSGGSKPPLNHDFSCCDQVLYFLILIELTYWYLNLVFSKANQNSYFIFQLKNILLTK